MQEVSGSIPLGSTKPFAKQKASRGSRFEEAMRAQRNSPYKRHDVISQLQTMLCDRNLRATPCLRVGDPTLPQATMLER